MIFIGIDCGKAGAIAAIDQSCDILLLEDYPTDTCELGCADILRNFFGRYSSAVKPGEAKFVIKAAVERAQSMPKQGVKSMFTYGDNFGCWKGILATLEIPILLPTPQQWQKGVISKAADKKPALAAARRLFPSAELIGPRGGAKDGRADALLIADWCRRQFIK